MKTAVIALSVAILLSPFWAKEGSQIGTGAEVAAPEAAATAKGAAEVGTALATETGLTAGGANIAALNMLGPSGVATYSAMESLAGLGPIATVAGPASSILSGAKTAATILSPAASLVQA